jgi:hypothetical protein
MFRLLERLKLNGSVLESLTNLSLESLEHVFRDLFWLSKVLLCLLLQRARQGVQSMTAARPEQGIWYVQASRSWTDMAKQNTFWSSR